MVDLSTTRNPVHLVDIVVCAEQQRVASDEFSEIFDTPPEAVAIAANVADRAVCRYSHAECYWHWSGTTPNQA